MTLGGGGGGGDAKSYDAKKIYFPQVLFFTKSPLRAEMFLYNDVITQCNQPDHYSNLTGLLYSNASLLQLKRPIPFFLNDDGQYISQHAQLLNPIN